MPTEWPVAEHRTNSIGVEWEIRNQQVAGSIPAGGSRNFLKTKHFEKAPNL
jgi:hypothetical protein